jgi:high affinity sulfate transporter 1
VPAAPPDGHPPSFLDRHLPGLALLRRYRRAWLRVDVLAGLTVGAMLVPQAMAYAELAGLPPEAGFYAVLGALVVYALVGSSRHLGVGPEPGTAILAATGVAPLAAGDPQRYAVLMAALALCVAAVCFIGALARLGFLADLLSRPVLVGYITGVGLVLLSSQLSKLTGVPIEADKFFGRMVDFLTGLDEIEAATFAMGVICLGAILVLRWKAPTLPSVLLVVVAATSVTWAFGLDEDGIKVVGDIPAGLPTPALPDVGWADVVDLLPVALGIALVGYSDNVLTGRSIAARLGYRVDPNQELVALGAENLASGLTQGFPISSSASRTAVPASLGSHTQLVGLVAGVFVAVALLALRGVLYWFPQPALAAVVTAAAIAIIDVDGLRALWRLDRSELALAVATATGVMVFDVLVGVLIAVALSAVAALGRMARPHDAVLGAVHELDGWVDVGDFPAARPLPGLLVYRFDAPLFFANASWFGQRVLHAMDVNPGEERWVVLDFEGVGSVDTTALEALADLATDLADLGVEVVGVARANTKADEHLRRAGLVGPDGPYRAFPTINAAVRAFREAEA